MKEHLRDPVLLVFFAIAALVVGGALALGWYEHRIGSWPLAPVEILTSEVVRDQYDRYQGQVKARTSGGQERVLTTTWSVTDPADMEAQMEAFPEGQTVGIPQNPEDPEDLRLPPDPNQAWLPWILASCGLLFALVPVGVVALTRREDALAVGGLVFVGCGLLVAGIGGAMILAKVDVLRNWTPAEATVLESRAGTRPGTRRPLHGIDLVVSYDAGGQTRRAAIGSRAGTSDAAWVQNQVATVYAVGTRHQILYDPSSQYRATFEAGWTLGYFWEGLLAAVLGLMMALGGAAMARYLRPKPAPKSVKP
jgi:hypothetical protein